ncbi:PREDICTED: FERM, RhoGEF and pleckstrin domain-containing protein 1-like [Priapulus caudatus]|uniref:FERM, RhoGEF and pleckstrin domain-containing protein 1-like n=1 Tax=Priapulus caudatus TaxID=37621 RepID=A0ABM1EZM8_PRICU|nr:PREDICTED: FERM, RhoGEF and pleckstrin domain-containing protein 1-like [Priapulus caudatus]
MAHNANSSSLPRRCDSPPRTGLASGGSITPVSTDTPRKGKYILARVVMLDDTEGLFKVPQKALGKVLYQQVCKNLNLLESDYFGLEFTDLLGNRCWLDLDKAFWKQVCGLPTLRFNFAVKFYTPDPGQLEEEYTRYLFALQIKRDLVTGAMPCNDATAALLASYVVQAECGDFTSEDYPDHSYLSHYKFVPHQCDDLERQIMDNHRRHVGLSPADADYMLLDIARKVELYGVKVHSARDHEGVPLNLAVAHLGLHVFQQFTKINTFSWAKVRKLSFKRRRFLVKLHPEGHGYYKDTVEFYFDDRDRCKNFWKKCVEHHAFFRCATVARIPRRRKTLLSKGSQFRYSGRTMKEMVDDVRDGYVKRAPFARTLSGRTSRSLGHLGGGGGPAPRINAALIQTSGASHHLVAAAGSDVTTPRSERGGDFASASSREVTPALTPSTPPPRIEMLPPQRLPEARGLSPSPPPPRRESASSPEVAPPGTVTADVEEGAPPSPDESPRKQPNVPSRPEIPYIPPPDVPPPPPSEPEFEQQQQQWRQQLQQQQQQLYQQQQQQQQQQQNRQEAENEVQDEKNEEDEEQEEVKQKEPSSKEEEIHALKENDNAHNAHNGAPPTASSPSPLHVIPHEPPAVPLKRKAYPHDRSYYMCKELLSTERTYRTDLEVITVALRREMAPLDDAAALGTIVSLVEPIHRVHCAVMKELEARLAAWETRPAGGAAAVCNRVGDVFLTRLDLDAYATYLDALAPALSALDAACRAGGALARFRRAFETRRDCYLPLNLLAVKPAQRLLHYRRVLETMLHYYGASHADAADLRAALAGVTATLDARADARRACDNLVKLIEVQRDLGGVDGVVDARRAFVREGCMQKFSKRGYQQRMFFLFSDALVYANRTSQPYLQFKVHGQLAVRGMVVEETPESRVAVPHCFALYNGSRAINVAASSEEEKYRWVEDINRAIAAAGRDDDAAARPPALRLRDDADDGRGGAGDDDTPEARERSFQQRGNTSTHVCWHRNASVGARDYRRAAAAQLSGYLLRKFKNSDGWQKLWVVFANFCLFFYKTFNDDAPLASLPVLGYAASTPEPCDAIQKDLVFKLQFKNHVYFFRAESEYLFGRWMEVVGSATQAATPHDRAYGGGGGGGGGGGLDSYFDSDY